MSDKQLRARVKLLGKLLGRVLHSQAGEQVYEAVEALRKGYINLHKTENLRKRQRLAQLIGSLDPETLTHVVRAFSTYFSLVNLAEEAYQHRERRRMVSLGGPLWYGSFDATLREFREQGMSAAQVQTLLDSLAFTPVITAHPTESKRRTVMDALRRIFVTSERLDAPGIGREEKEEITQLLEAQIQILWKTDEVRTQRPQVSDEIRNAILYFRESLFDAVPRTYRYLEKGVQRIYGPIMDPKNPITVPSFLRFGSWIGGDRDGNPNVTPETTALALRLNSRAALLEYITRLTRLSHVLTHSILLCKPSPEFIVSLRENEHYCARAFQGNPTRFEHEPYRRKLYIMRYRLERNLADIKARLEGLIAPAGEDGYRSEDEFLEDLYLIRGSLINHGDRNTADGELKDLIRLVESFGFFLAQLDVRQESSRHTAAVAEILALQTGKVDYLALNEQQRMQILAERMGEAPRPIDPAMLSPQTRETAEVFHTMAHMRHEISPRAFGNYVISMTHAASHVMEVMFLAHLAGLAGRDNDEWHCNIHISPLFETIDDLTHIETVLTALLDNPVYATLLHASGNVQEVMLGYSDSCKDGGILASAWSLYAAQKTITAIAASRDIQCRIFHGRGGTVGRGGGPTHESIVSQPPGTVHGQIKFTEQGEVLSYKYSNAETAVNELTMGVTGLLKASCSLIMPPPAEQPEHMEIMQYLAKTGEETYRRMTDHTAGFLDYFYQATPVDEISLLNIGSRPSHRNRANRSKSSIRAIPWVFGWGQSRHTLPAWYGIGTALEGWVKSGGHERMTSLQDMYRDMPFFRSLLSNTQMALFKANMTIAQQYADLCQDRETAQIIFDTLRGEYERTVSLVLQVADARILIEENPTLALSLKRRDPYLDPLNYIQITLLKRYRDTGVPENERLVWLDPLLRSINAVAAGLRNTG